LSLTWLIVASWVNGKVWGVGVTVGIGAGVGAGLELTCVVQPSKAKPIGNSSTIAKVGLTSRTLTFA
jgi:hypothetical protein